MTALIDRYLAGEHERVWSELVAAGSAALIEPLRSMAEAVARETMLRARANIESLTARLPQVGYQFGSAETCSSATPDARLGEPHAQVAPYQLPLPQRRTLLGELETMVGPVPLSLVAWYDLVGAVNLMGAHPEWRGLDETALPDPLVVDPLDSVLDDARERLTDPAWLGQGDQTYLYLAPDEYHKENISGGPPYSLLVQPAADAPLLFEWHRTTFVDYLRQAFRWGGFPGLARAQRRPDDALAYLREGLIPL